MDKLKAKQAALARRQRRVRGKVSGTAERPRLRVTRTNAHIYAQVIDDVAGVTLVVRVDRSSRRCAGSSPSREPTATPPRRWARPSAQSALEAGITEVVFDRGGRLYHGRVKALADGARSAGLEF